VALIRWAVLTATASADSADTCRLSAGACWPILLNHLNLLLFGTYPAELRWRAAAALLALGVGVATLLFSATRRWRWWRCPRTCSRFALAFVLVVGPPPLGCRRSISI